MKIGINLYPWADQMHDGLLPILESLTRIGHAGMPRPSRCTLSLADVVLGDAGSLGSPESPNQKLRRPAHPDLPYDARVPRSSATGSA